MNRAQKINLIKRIKAGAVSVESLRQLHKAEAAVIIYQAGEEIDYSKMPEGPIILLPDNKREFFDIKKVG